MSNMSTIEIDKVYTRTLSNLSFCDLSSDEVFEVLSDGRFAAPFIERQLTTWFPLIHVKGNKDHDHIDEDGNLYDAKNFTKGGLNFMPSNQIGAGRSLDKNIALEKANKLIYICVDITKLPDIQIIFKKGGEMAQKYESFKVPFKKLDELFTTNPGISSSEGGVATSSSDLPLKSNTFVDAPKFNKADFMLNTHI